MYEMSALHSNLSPHGLDAHEVEAAMRKPLVPERMPDDTKRSLSTAGMYIPCFRAIFLIQGSYQIGVTEWAAKNAIRSNSGEDFGNFKRCFPSKI
jgi:hypothetical protein